MSSGTWMSIGLRAIDIAAILQTVFVALYATRPWWRHFVGRALFLKSLAFMVVLDLSVVGRYWTYPYQLQVAAIVLCLVAAAIAYQTGALIMQIRHDRRDK